MTHIQQVMDALLQGHMWSSTHDVARRTGWPLQRAAAALRGLERSGRIERHTVGRSMVPTRVTIWAPLPDFMAEVDDG